MMCTDDKKGIKLMLSVDMPQPLPQKPEKKAPPIEDKVREALEKIDSGYDSSVEWSMIRGLYKQLREVKKPSDRAMNIMQMIEPVLSKYGYTVSVRTGSK